MAVKMHATVTQHQLEVGYDCIHKLASDHGKGFMLSMVSKESVQAAVAQIYLSMAAVAPAPVAVVTAAAPVSAAAPGPAPDHDKPHA